MAYQHRMQENRFELKYIISERCARDLREFSRAYLVPDPYANPAKGFSYPIHSLYLDSPALDLCQATVRGLKNRFKLRLRYYDNNPASPVFFEIKRRVNDAILKRRAPVRRECALAMLSHYCPRMEDLVNPEDPKAYDGLRQFCEIAGAIDARGQAIVSYTREAWVTEANDTIRVTFDRDISGELWAGDLTIDGVENGVHPEIGGVILEIKFTDRFPVWMREMVRIFNLQRRSMAKYVTCLMRLKSRELLVPITEAAL